MHRQVPGLAMTRSLGDSVAASVTSFPNSSNGHIFYVEQVGVTAEPEIDLITVEESNEFIVLASDGVWEFLSNQEVVDIVGKVGTTMRS